MAPDQFTIQHLIANSWHQLGFWGQTIAVVCMVIATWANRSEKRSRRE